MDMKKFLQAVDEASSTKPVEGSNDMKKFLNIMEGKGPLNRLSQAENIALNTYNAYAPVEKAVVKPSLIDKYFKEVEVEYAESQNIKDEQVKQLAERVSRKVGGNYGHQSNFKKHISQAQRPPENIIQMAKKGAKVDNNRRYKTEETDPVDTVTLDIPLLLRIMEYSKEDAQDDMALHDVTQRLIELSKKVDVIDMSHYDAIVSGNVDESLRTDNPCWKGYKPVGTKKKGGRTVPNCVPK